MCVKVKKQLEDESLFTKMDKVSGHCDYRMRSQWEKSFDDPRLLNQWDCIGSPWDRVVVPKEQRTSHRKYPESKTHFISFWVDDEEKCTSLRNDMDKYECTWMYLLRVEKEGRYYIEGVVRYRIPKSRRWVLRTMDGIIPNGLMVSRMLYNSWEKWLGEYMEQSWYEKGEKPKAWHQIERKYMKRKYEEEEEENTMRLVREGYEKMLECKCSTPMGRNCLYCQNQERKCKKLLYKDTANRRALQEDYERKMEEEESETEIDCQIMKLKDPNN